MLRTQGTSIIDGAGRKVQLKGVNAGGWLMMEGYIMHAPNRAEQMFKRNFAKSLGEKTLAVFEEDFRDHFIREDDFKNIARLGFNCIRVPFNHRLVEKSPYKYDAYGVGFLDKAVRWAEKYKVYVILDLHGAPGAQNHDWHSDSLGKAELWSKNNFRLRTYALWEFLADRYRDAEWVAGYDLLNEAVTDDAKGLNDFYKKAIQAIRRADRKHILFVEGNKWAQDLECLEHFEDENTVLSAHFYIPLEFTFNFVPHLSYPLKNFKKDAMRKILIRYEHIAQKRRCPVFIGEFGVNARQGVYGEEKWVKDAVSCFNELGFHWTYWTYKAVKNSVFPDGIYSFMENPPWVNRPGPLQGWETWHLHWAKSRRDMVRSWETKSFTANKHILKVLQDAV